MITYKEISYGCYKSEEKKVIVNQIDVYDDVCSIRLNEREYDNEYTKCSFEIERRVRHEELSDSVLTINLSKDECKSFKGEIVVYGRSNSGLALADFIREYKRTLMYEKVDTFIYENINDTKLIKVIFKGE